MGEQKKFDIVEIILLFLVSAVADILTLAAYITLVIPVIGQAMWFASWIIGGSIWALTTFWFIMKVGWGGGALLQTAGGIASFIVPARTLTVLVGVVIANNPELRAAAEAASGDIKAAEKDASSALSGATGAQPQPTNAADKATFAEIEEGPQREVGETPEKSEEIPEPPRIIAEGTSDYPLDELKSSMENIPTPQEKSA